MQFLTDGQKVELACKIAFELAFSDLQPLETYGIYPEQGEGWANLYDVLMIEAPQSGILIPDTGEITLLCEQYERYDVITALDMCFDVAKYTIEQYERAIRETSSKD